ncbi:probable serine hydrolase [Chrysoperla carnea]|uniref:probable serine hydrolase n=1 Tax=Chrysoperla carnea TaxID=189513 RepID=UPI001D078CAA|nr:probable serine hydrolase [Chrysoperla carnea]
MLFSKLYKPNYLKTFTNLRTITTTKCLKVEHAEIRIPVPWGHVSGQWWGSKEQRPILAVAGWKDNIGTFLPLIEEVSKHVGIVCIEVSGLGLSTPFPPGFFYNFDAALTIVHHVLDHFKWDKVSFMGHSLGSGTAFMYAALYPELVDFIVGIDMLVPMPTSRENFCKVRRTSLDSFLAWDKAIARGERKLYTYEEAQEEVTKNTFNSIPREFTAHLLQRELVRSDSHPGRYYFRMDPRHNVKAVTYPPEQILEMAEQVRCPILNIKGTEFPFIEGETMYYKVCEILKKNNVPLQIENVQGSHHVHLTNTDDCVPIVKDFIRKYDSEERFSEIPNADVRKFYNFC